jgi:hypothetical protein
MPVKFISKSFADSIYELAQEIKKLYDLKAVKGYFDMNHQDAVYSSCDECQENSPGIEYKKYIRCGYCGAKKTN